MVLCMFYPFRDESGNKCPDYVGNIKVWTDKIKTPGLLFVDMDETEFSTDFVQRCLIYWGDDILEYDSKNPFDELIFRSAKR